jgi:hypothetical protein
LNVNALHGTYESVRQTAPLEQMAGWAKHGDLYIPQA